MKKLNFLFALLMLIGVSGFAQKKETKPTVEKSPVSVAGYHSGDSVKVDEMLKNPKIWIGGSDGAYVSAIESFEVSFKNAAGELVTEICTSEKFSPNLIKLLPTAGKKQTIKVSNVVGRDKNNNRKPFTEVILYVKN